MNKGDKFSVKTPNGVTVEATLIYKRRLQSFVNYIQYEYVAYAQNRLFTSTQMVRVIDADKYNSVPIEYGKVLVDYVIISEYDRK